MNRASLDRDLLNRVSWTSKTLKVGKGVNDYENNLNVAVFITAQKIRDILKFYETNVIDWVEQQLKKLSSAALVLIGGDFNARIGTEPYYITEDP